MLPENLWKPWQPRVAFPAFAGSLNVFEFTIQDSLEKLTFKQFLTPAYAASKKVKSWSHALNDYKGLILRQGISFQVFRLSAGGVFQEKLFQSKEIGIGESFTFRHDLREMKENEMILFVASRGRADKMSSSPGNMTVRYTNPQAVCGYRTGFFARPLNSGKGHFGYTGLNPALSYNPQIQSGNLLINHSSEPSYNQSVNPKIRLHRSKEEYVEASFGEIQPHGFREVNLQSLFPEFEKWKSESPNLWTVSECKGVTLASFHTYRNREGNLLAIEHSRPSHTQVIDYWKKK
jgi:hypothetical protein